MNELHYENAFSSVPPMVHQRVSDTLQEVKTMKKAKPVAMVLLAAALVVILTGAAYAAVQSGVLDFLFRGNEPSAQQKELVQAIGVSHESDGITTTLTDAVFDGRELSVGLLFHAQRNAFVVIDHVAINGVPAYRLNDDFGNLWLAADPFASGEGDYAKGLTATIDQDYFDPSELAALQKAYRAIADNGSADISVGLSLLVPRQALTKVDLFSMDTVSMWDAIDAACAAGDTPVSAEEPFEVVTGSAYLGDEFGNGLPAQYPLDDANACIQYANMTALDRFTLDFSLDTNGESADENKALQLNPSINDGRFHITYDKIRCTPFSTKINLSITPEEGYMTNEDIARIYKYFVYYRYDGQGNLVPLELQESVVVSSGSGFEKQADGSLVYKIDLDLGPLVNRPDTIEIVPYNDESGPETPLWEYAIPVLLAD